MPTTTNTTGIATLLFGAANVINGLANVECISADFDAISERVKAKGSTGTTKRTTTIHDGRKGTVTCWYDSAITWPVEGGLVAVKEVGENNASNFEVISKPKIARKNTDHATITLELEKHGDINI